MTSTPKSGKYVQENDSASPSPLAGSGPGGHKPSFKSTKLARRARSFKDDFLGKISQMRSPAGTGLRSHSPKSTSNVGGAAGVPSTTAIIGGVAGVSKSDMGGDMHGFHMPPQKGPIHELDDLCKQIQIALKHFRDVVSKQILEMLPGNGTVVLDTVWHINLAVKSSVEAENSSSITSATNHMYQSVARLIKLCDDILLDNKSSELDANNVNEIVNQVEDAVKNLIQLAQEKISNQQQQINYKTTPRSYGNTSLEMPAQRNSLPDIPLTPREREILENTSCITPAMVRSSHSTESILRDSSPPPPKPPLPDSICRTTVDAPSFVTPPPLPPKKKSGSRQTHTPRSNIHHHHHHDDFNNSNIEMSPGVLTSLERISLRSKSPEDSISLRSESAGSIDSMLNHSSREEDEIKALMDGDPDYDLHRTADIFVANGSNSWEESSLSSSISNNNNEYQTSVNDYHRLSNADSGFVSFRSSNYSKRSSQQSSISSSQFVTKHSSNSEMVKSESIVQNLNKTETQLSLKKASTSSTSSTSSFTVLSNSQQSMSCGLRQDELDFLNTPDDSSVPPAIPQKTRRKTQERQPSPYDNVPDDSLGAELLVTCQMHQSHQSLSSSTSISSSSIVQQDSTKPPPLPPKKKHMFQSVAYSVMAYMEMFGNCSHTNDQEFMRHSVHMVQQSSHWTPPPTLVPALPTTQSCSFNHTQSSLSSRSSHTQIQSLTTASHSSGIDRIPSPLHSPSHLNNNHMPTVTTIPPALPPKQRSRKGSAKTSPPTTPSYTITAPTSNSGDIKRAQSPPKVLPDLLEHTATTTATPTVTTTEDKPKTADVNPCDIDLMDELNVDKYLVLKKPEEDAPDIRGGPIDALIIQATKATRNGVFTYQEAFLTTYRTFITPDDLITKLIRRYNHFYYQPDKKPRSREAFALIVRVVSDLTVSDLEVHLQLKLMNFVQQLISCGELTLAKALRVKHLERHGAKKMAASINILNVTQTISLTPRDVTLLSFKSEQIAEQMTLLDAELFMKIEIPEVLIWAQEQNEERSPNLTRFTEHFNKMSYWARTKLLQAETKDIREKYFLKFIKVMKHLRKINNFNSYLALLSALDSAPIRRLEWQKHVQEGLKEYCALIDSSSSFRAYRQALAETQPPCIPYIGLVLQDLTFVHIGNSNLLPNGSINFTKRWQQFNIVENMKKFKKSSYTFKKNEKIIDFFSNFNDCMCEDAMWQMSETIKPRGGKKPTNQ